MQIGGELQLAIVFAASRIETETLGTQDAQKNVTALNKEKIFAFLHVRAKTTYRTLIGAFYGIR